LGPLSLQWTVEIAGHAYRLVLWEHALALAVVGLVLWGALPVHQRIGRTPWLAVALGISAIALGALFVVSCRGWVLAQAPVVFAAGYLAASGCALLFTLRGDEDDRGSSSGDSDDGSPPWWPQFERDLADYYTRGTPCAPSRPRIPA